MSEWKVISTETFSSVIKKHKKDKQLLNELDKKIKRLQDDPHSVGGYLSGRLHGSKSTRLVGKYRLVFEIDEKGKSVYLKALDHRKFDYESFS